MTVHIRQLNGRKVADDRSYIPNGMSDQEYLDIKAASHEAKGWTVTRQPGGFTAVKKRWGGVACRRTFEVE